jgi:hypothetical protein
MYRAKVLASMLAVAAIIVASSPVRAAEQNTVRTKTVSDQPTTTSDVSLTTEFSAASRGEGHGGVSRSSGGGKSVSRSSGSGRSAGRRSSSGKSASSGSGKSKSASGGSKSKSTSSGGTGKTGTGTGKTATGTSTGTGKTGTGTGKLGAGPGNTGTGKTATGTGKTGTGTGKLGAGPGKTYREQMGPTNNSTPTTQNAQPPQNKLPLTPKDSATAAAVNDFNGIKAKVRERYPNATDLQLNTWTLIVINRHKQEAAAKAAEEQRKAYWQWKHKDNADTNARRAEQNARDNYNPNAEQYRPSGITEEEHNSINQRSLRGQPDGTE